MSGSSQSSGSGYMPTPPMVIAGQQTTTQAIETGNSQLKALLNIIHGGKSRRIRRRMLRNIYGKKSKRPRRRARHSRKSRKIRRRHLRSSRRHRHRGGNGDVALNIPPVNYNNTSVPGPSDITKSLLQTAMQANANGALDAVGSGSGSGSGVNR